MLKKFTAVRANATLAFGFTPLSYSGANITIFLLEAPQAAPTAQQLAVLLFLLANINSIVRGQP